MPKLAVVQRVLRITLATFGLTAALSAGVAQAAPLTLEPAAPVAGEPALIDSGGGSIDYAWPFRLLGSSNLDTPANSCRLSGGTWIPDLGCDHGAPGTKTSGSIG